MTEYLTHLELVRQAQAGEQDATSTLAERVRGKVYPFIYRTLLDPDKSEELTQETILAVLESFGQLRNPERFWPWVLTIATNRLRLHIRYRSRHRALQMLGLGSHYLDNRSDEGFTLASRKELGELTREALSQLGLNYRMVLSLRFYEDMPHAEIAQVLGCSELTARVRFYQAKRALAQELTRLGVNRNSLLAALGAFGGLTLAPSAKAATVYVSPAAAGEGLTTLLACAPGRVATLVACLAAVVALGAFGTKGRTVPREPPAMTVPTPPADPITVNPDARHVHFSTSRVMFTENAIPGARYKFWYLYPEGSDGAVLMRMEAWDPQQSRLNKWVLQTSEAYYKVNPKKNTVFICNYGLLAGACDYDPLPTLPTDPQAMSDFAVAVEGEHAVAMGNKSNWTPIEFNFQRDPRTGYVISHEETSPQGEKEVSLYDYSRFDGKLLAFTLPPGMKVVDLRDKLYKRGWICFDVTGESAGQPVTGLGRLPLTYGASRSHTPFLQMKIGRMTMVDRNTDALLIEGDTGTTTPFAGRSFFKGLARPWMGFTAADTIRRDAAREWVWYSNPYLRDDNKMEFTILKEDKATGKSLMAKYLIDRTTGLVERIEYRQATDNAYDKVVGHLVFTYETDSTAVDAAESLIPGPTGAGNSTEQTDVFWPLDLMDRKPQSPTGLTMADPDDTDDE